MITFCIVFIFAVYVHLHAYPHHDICLDFQQLAGKGSKEVHVIMVIVADCVQIGLYTRSIYMIYSYYLYILYDIYTVVPPILQPFILRPP